MRHAPRHIALPGPFTRGGIVAERRPDFSERISIVALLSQIRIPCAR